MEINSNLFSREDYYQGNIEYSVVRITEEYYLGSTPSSRMPVTTRIVTFFLVGNPDLNLLVDPPKSGQTKYNDTESAGSLTYEMWWA